LGVLLKIRDAMQEDALFLEPLDAVAVLLELLGQKFWQKVADVQPAVEHGFDQGEFWLHAGGLHHPHHLLALRRLEIPVLDDYYQLLKELRSDLLTFHSVQMFGVVLHKNHHLLLVNWRQLRKWQVLAEKHQHVKHSILLQLGLPILLNLRKNMPRKLIVDLPDHRVMVPRFGSQKIIN
jgi:hypothetical protein